MKLLNENNIDKLGKIAKYNPITINDNGIY
jgi:hypothetical protein